MHNNENLKLSSVNLLKIDSKVDRPKYDRNLLRPNTVHIGVGGFHRAHQAVYLDELLNSGTISNWGECGLGVLASDTAMQNALSSQDYLYTVIERSAHRQRARIVGSIIDYVCATENSAAAIERLASSETKLVSLTITEGGYFIRDSTGEFMMDDPSIKHDLEFPDNPKTSLGYITAALKRRRDRGLGPFTLMSCDNLQNNGNVLKKVILGLAEQQDPALRNWISHHVAFPNSMVDRITPATTTADKSLLLADYGVLDAWPVVTEPFKQWVIENEFCNDRPTWEDAGAELVSDVAPYELMKMRLLNGSHMAMAFLGALAGLTYAHDVMQNRNFLHFIRAFMEEVTPVVPEIAGTSITGYKSVLIERFSNPTINDQISRLCSEASAKLPKWVFPSILELAKLGKNFDLLGLVIASWISYLQEDFNEQSQPIEVVDVNAKELKQMARSNGGVRAFLASPWVFGNRLDELPGFADLVQDGLTSIQTRGAERTVEYFVQLERKGA